jgi:uncharacterized protein
MSKPVVEVKVRAAAAISGGCAVFLGNEDKVIVIFDEQGVGAAIAMFMQGTQKERRSPTICQRTSCVRLKRRSKG